MQNRNQQTEKYRFNEAKHLHELLVDGQWKALTGCTTVLGVIAKPALIQWSANETVKWIRENAKNYSDLVEADKEYGTPWLVYDKQLDEAKLAHRKKKEKAGDWGTQVHAWAESFIKSKMEGTQAPALPEDPIQAKAAAHFMKWAENNKVRFLVSEKGLYSEKYFIGGIVDIICEVDGKVWMADIKTGSGIYPEHFAQMAGYQIMSEEMGMEPINGHIVLNLTKEGKFDERRSVSLDDSKRLFLGALDIYRVQEKLKNQVI